MTGSLTVVAPGKLMIAGEYSVLGPGGEALAMAVEPGVEAVATPAAAWELGRADSAVAWREGEAVPDDLRFAHRALVVGRGVLGVSRPHRIVTRVLGGTGTGGRKPGVGGSASATAAVAGVLFRIAGRALTDDALLDVALRAHQDAQGGRGSGYDVATVVTGGLVLWRPARIAGPGAPPREAVRIAWPSGLEVLAGYSGRSASTAGFLGDLDRVAEADRAGVAQELMALGRHVGALVDAFRASDVPGVLAGVRACHRALRDWDRARQLGIVTDEVARLIALAEACGAAAKVSGAGGGDSVLAFASDGAVLEEVALAWRAEGFEPLPFRMCSAGLCEKSPEPA